MKAIFAVLLILHGFVHMWYFVLSQRLVKFKPEMGWTGESWLLSNLFGDSASRWIASIAYVIATIAFIVGGIGLLSRGIWWRPVIAISACFSAATILVFWDGSTKLLVQRGLIGFLLNITIVILILVIGWPATK
jgi:hypothetical protein